MSQFDETKLAVADKDTLLKSQVEQIAQMEMKYAKLEAQFITSTSESASELAAKEDGFRAANAARDDAMHQLKVCEGELSRARAASDKLEQKVEELEKEVAVLSGETDAAASKAKEMGRGYEKKKEAFEELEAKYNVVAEEVKQIRDEKDSVIANLKAQLEAETRKVFLSRVLFNTTLILMQLTVS